MPLKKEQVFSVPDAVRDVLYQSGFKLSELADMVDLDVSTLSRMGTEGPAGTKFIESIRKIIKLTKTTGNLAIVKTICRLTGQTCCKEARGSIGKAQKETLIADFNLEHALILKTLALFLTEPTEPMKKDLFKMLTEYMETTASIRRRISVNHLQRDLFDEN